LGKQTFLYGIEKSEKSKGPFLIVFQDALLSLANQSKEAPRESIRCLFFIFAWLDYGGYFYYSFGHLARCLRTTPKNAKNIVGWFKTTRFQCASPYDYFPPYPLFRAKQPKKLLVGLVKALLMSVLVGFKLKIAKYNGCILKIIKRDGLPSDNLRQSKKPEIISVSSANGDEYELILLPDKSVIFSKRISMRIFQEPLRSLMQSLSKKELSNNCLRVLLVILAKTGEIHLKPFKTKTGFVITKSINVAVVKRKEIADILGISEPKVSLFLEQLEKVGLIGKIRNLNDKRRQDYVINPSYFWIGDEQCRLRAVRKFNKMKYRKDDQDEDDDEFDTPPPPPSQSPISRRRREL